MRKCNDRFTSCLLYFKFLLLLSSSSSCFSVLYCFIFGRCTGEMVSVCLNLFSMQFRTHLRYVRECVCMRVGLFVWLGCAQLFVSFFFLVCLSLFAFVFYFTVCVYLRLFTFCLWTHNAQKPKYCPFCCCCWCFH